MKKHQSNNPTVSYAISTKETRKANKPKGKKKNKPNKKSKGK